MDCLVVCSLISAVTSNQSFLIKDIIQNVYILLHFFKHIDVSMNMWKYLKTMRISWNWFTSRNLNPKISQVQYKTAICVRQITFK